MDIDKLIAKLKVTNSPCSFSDFSKIAKHFGFVIDHISGSHHVYRNWTGRKFVVPVHGKKIKAVYIKLFLKEQI